KHWAAALPLKPMPPAVPQCISKFRVETRMNMAEPQTQPIRVMLVDDHRTLLWGLERLIQGQSPKMEEVGTAEDCDTAVVEAGRLQPDVVLLDLDLRGKSSVNIIPALLSNGVSRVLVLTAWREQAVLDEAVLC